MEVMEKRRELHLGRVKWLGRGSGMHCCGAGGFNVPSQEKIRFQGAVGCLVFFVQENTWTTFLLKNQQL